MAAFMEKSSIEVQNVHTCRNRNRRAHFKAITLIQGPEVRNYLTGRDNLANQDNFYSPRTVVDNFIKSEGDTGKQRVD